MENIKKPNFDFKPLFTVDGEYGEVINEAQLIKNINFKLDEGLINKIVIDAYLGVDYCSYIDELKVDYIIDLNDYMLSEEEIEYKFSHYFTKHPVNGIYVPYEIDAMYQESTFQEIKNKINNGAKILIIGLGASYFATGDFNIYLNDLYNKAKNKLLGKNEYYTEKRLEFFDLHLISKHKRYALKNCDIIVDYNSRDLNAVPIDIYIHILDEITKKPFRTTPLLEENVWGGGKWFVERLGLEENGKNYSFLISAILEQQFVDIEYQGLKISIPGEDIISLKPNELLGEKIFYTYGYRTMTHLLIVDTIGGSNSSIQVHPTVEYNQNKMNYPYGHHEGYYIINSTKDSGVYLGYNDKLTLDEVFEKFNEGLKDKSELKKYISYFPVNKFDYIYLPGGTIHAFGAETVCLEIDASSTTTFKLWDWNRSSDTGEPRYLDTELGKEVSQGLYSDAYAKEHLFSKEDREKLHKNGMSKIGTMEHCPMNVEKYLLEDGIVLSSTNQLGVIVIVEGESAIIRSCEQDFEDIEIHYMETFYIPSHLKKFQIIPVDNKIEVLHIKKEL